MAGRTSNKKGHEVIAAHTASPGGKAPLKGRAPLVRFVGVVKPERYTPFDLVAIVLIYMILIDWRNNMERFSKPGVGGIIEKEICGELHILIQQRFKVDAPDESGLFEIPAGKIREFENIFDCLRREIKEETGLDVVEIENEKEAVIYERNGYKVLFYTPFASAQNIDGTYPIMVQTFICKVTGEIIKQSDEAQNIKWIPISDLRNLLINQDELFYPMHVEILKKYLKIRLNGSMT